MKVIIVDNDKWYSESLASSLRSYQEDIKTEIVANADDAIAVIDQQLPDIIVLDFSLGSKNALVLLNELQSYPDTREIPIVLLSEDESRLYLNDFRQYGVKIIINKITATPKEIYQCLRV